MIEVVCFFALRAYMGMAECAERLNYMYAYSYEYACGSMCICICIFACVCMLCIHIYIYTRSELWRRCKLERSWAIAVDYVDRLSVGAFVGSQIEAARAHRNVHQASQGQAN